ncbi:MAG: hypothetical protein LBU76_11465 [Azoarcus sp.]|jgi:hypothetical protein|nr:hypothetical protein [Azoarcus sp.]
MAEPDTFPDQNPNALAGENDIEIDRVAGIVSTAKTYIASLHTGDSMLSLEERAPRALEKFLDTLGTLCPNQETAPERIRWTAAASQSMHDFLEALRTADRAEPGCIPAAVLARAGAEAVRWNLVNRHATRAGIWSWLGELFASSYGEETQRVQGTGETVGREYLRAIAYHAAALDQQTLKAGFAIARLIALLLSNFSLTREHVKGAFYGVDVAQRAIPARQKEPASFAGWWFVTGEAADKLSDIHADLARGQVPVGLEAVDAGDLRAAATHLRRLWSPRPPLRRYRRFPINARLCVVRGYEQAMNLLNDDAMEGVAVGMGAWHITDMSRGGIGAVTPRNIKVNVPVAGDLVAYCPEEGTQWHIGVVRRLRTTKSHIEIGIATLSDNPELMRVDDGRQPRELCACDPVRPGVAIRLLAPIGALEGEHPVFVVKESEIYKLCPVGDVLKGKSFDLRVYQVA